MKDKKSINNIEYVLVGDYYVPDLKLPHEERPIGKYGRMHREYLKEHSPMRFNDLVLEGQLWTYLADLNEQAQERLSLIVEQMKVAESMTEELKAGDQMVWVQAMNNIYNRAEEIILWELIYEEDMVRNFTRNFGTKHRADGSSCKEYKKLLELI